MSQEVRRTRVIHEQLDCEFGLGRMLPLGVRARWEMVAYKISKQRLRWCRLKVAIALLGQTR